LQKKDDEKYAVIQFFYLPLKNYYEKGCVFTNISPPVLLKHLLQKIKKAKGILCFMFFVTCHNFCMKK